MQRTVAKDLSRLRIRDRGGFLDTLAAAACESTRIAGIAVLAVAAAATPVLAAAPKSPRGAAAPLSHRRGQMLPANAVQDPFAVAVDGPNRVIVANREGIFVLTSGSSRLTNVSPHAIGRSYDHVGEIQADGPDVWVAMEGSSVFDFLLYSNDAGRAWHVKRFPGFISNLAVSSREVASIAITLSSGVKRGYVTRNSGHAWNVSSAALRATAPPYVAGERLPPRGVTPARLKLVRALRYPRGTAWAQSTAPNGSSPSPTYLLRSEDGGRRWSLVTAR